VHKGYEPAFIGYKHYAIFAYVGIVVGAGFSTGQEVMQFFTPYGLWSYIGVLPTTMPT
jgi:uncharacterized membrane protein YkvI